MINQIIKGNMEYFNMSNKDLSLLTGITERTIRNILDGSTAPTLETLSHLEDAFKLERGDLYAYLISPSYEIESEEIYNAIDYSTGEILAKESIITKMRKLLSGTFSLYKHSLESRSLNFYKFKDSELVYFWIALNENKAIGIKTDGTYESKNKKMIFNTYLEVMFNEDTFDNRIELMTKMLSENGIILINSPFIKGTSTRGVSLLKNKTRYIFMNDMNKREYNYIFALGHEIMHIINREQKEDNEYLSSEIKKYLMKNNINHEISLSFDLYSKSKGKFSKDDWNKLHENTKLKINFGDSKEFISKYL